MFYGDEAAGQVDDPDALARRCALLCLRQRPGVGVVSSADAVEVLSVRGFFSVKKGAVMQSLKIGLWQWLVAMYLTQQTKTGRHPPPVS